MAREIDNGPIVVNEGEIVIVSDTQKKKYGIFARVGVSELGGGEAMVGLLPVIADKS